MMNRKRSGAKRGPVLHCMSPASTLRCLVLAAILLLGFTVPAYAQEPTPEPNVYVVQRGDTLFEIAQRYGTSVEAILDANEIADRSLIFTGQKLVIPGAGSGKVSPDEGSLGTSANSRVHPVRAGENLLALAFRYGTTAWDLRQANDLNRFGLLWPGQPLIIPPPTASTAQTPDFPMVRTLPAPMLQGRTMVVKVRGGGDLDIEGQFLDADLTFAAEDGQQWALVGVDALTPQGEHTLALTIVEPDSGDRLTIQESILITATSFTTYNIPVPTDRQNLLDPNLSRQERQKLNKVFSLVSEERLWDGLFSFPLAGGRRTTAPFGQRRSYAGGPVTSYHTGHDYGADTGVPVLAPITGTVALAEPLQVRGNAVILDHGQGVFTGFWHLSQIDVEEGQVVGRGERVGLVGNTGLSTGPHLHWEMRVHNVPVIPLQWTRQVFP
jgi:murein DD-endopeptidase MepM/ murein hydrolase activator NlpD